MVAHARGRITLDCSVQPHRTPLPDPRQRRTLQLPAPTLQLPRSPSRLAPAPFFSAAALGRRLRHVRNRLCNASVSDAPPGHGPSVRDGQPCYAPVSPPSLLTSYPHLHTLPPHPLTHQGDAPPVSHHSQPKPLQVPASPSVIPRTLRHARLLRFKRRRGGVQHTTL